LSSSNIFLGDLVLNHLWRYNGYDDVGLVVAILNSFTSPQLLAVMWNNGKIEKVYEDEVEGVVLE